LAVLAFALVALTFGLPTSDVRAEGGLESLKGGLFHRKGWIHPEIYRKKQKPAKAVRSATNRPNTTTPRRSQRKATSRPRIVSIKKKARARRAKLRIPARVVRRTEKNLKRSQRRKALRNRKKVRVASLGNTLSLPRSTRKLRRKSITGGGARVQWVARSSCVPGRLKAAINYVARNFGRVRVNSTCRSRRHNRRVGGASRSWHLSGRAADIRVFGNIRKAARYLRRVAGGYKHYGGGLFHIDTGPKRSW